jgi:hypothetical protein
MHEYSYPHLMPHSTHDHLPPPPPLHHDIDAAFRYAHGSLSSLPRSYYDMPMPGASQYPPALRPGSPRSRSPFPPGFPFNYESDSYAGPERHYPSQQSVDENFRRYGESLNIAVWC